MGKIFSKNLRKFYSRNGNKVIFKNRLTLNQLALEMSEKLGFKEIDASVISRVIKGERIFSQKQLGVFSEVLKLDECDINTLRRALHSEVYSKFQGKYLLSGDKDDLIATLKNNLEIVKEANGSGFPVLAIEWAELNEKRIRSFLLLYSDLDTLHKLKEYLFRFLEQHAISVIRREMPDKALKIAWPIIEEMQNIAIDLRNPHLEGLVYAKKGDVLSLVGGLHNDKKVLEQSNLFFRKSSLLLNSNMAYYPLSYGMLNASYLKDVKLFKSLEKSLRKELVSIAFSKVCESYNLIAKSKINLGISDGLEDDFIKAWDSLEKISQNKKNSRIFRKVQLLRTEIQGASSGFSFRNLGKMNNVIREGLFYSKEFGYLRYFNTTKQIINKNKDLLKFDVDLS